MKRSLKAFIIMGKIMRKFVEKIKLFVVAALCVVVASSVFVGCGTFMKPTDYEFCFNEPSAVMYVGGTWNIKTDDFTVDGASALFGIKSVALKNAVPADGESAVVSVSGKTVSGVSTGKATIVATANNGKTAECSITVRDRFRSLSLETESRAVKAGEEALVYAVINDGDVATSGVKWQVDGNVVKNYTGGEYSFTSATEGKRTITASYSVGDKTLTAQADFYFYSSSGDSFDASGVTVEKTESANGATYSLYGSAEGNAAIEWTINGKIETAFTDKTEIAIEPSEAGKYIVGVTVNGTKKNCEPYVKNGSRVPAEVKVDIDRNDKKILVSWAKTDENETFTVEYRTGNGAWKSVSATGNGALIERYSGSAAIVDVTGPTEYRVKSNGNGDYLAGSDYSETVSVESIPAEAIGYLDKAWYGGNYYVTSDDEFCEIYDYFMLFRTQPNGGSTTGGGKIYFGYESKYLLERLCSIAFNRANYTGSYATGYSREGNEVEINLTFNTISYPTVSTSGSEAKNLSLNGHIPHFGESGWPSDDVLPIDEIAGTATVNTTDQLYRVAEAGIRPVPESGSRAEKYYAIAKATVRKITDPTMNDYEKAHAVYDWILSRVVYATKASRTDGIEDAVKNTAFYIEGVFANGFYAVCDGKSKAFSLMCNILGVKCIRVVGEAGEGGNTGGHAWNKVFVGGRWYIVDTTWGDVATTADFGSIRQSKEVETHAYLFKTDRQVASTHFEEPYGNYPKTAAIPYDVYKSMTFTAHGTVTACRLTDANKADDFAESLKTYVKSELSAGKRSFELPYYEFDTVTKALTEKTEKRESGFVTAEFSVPSNYNGGVSAAKNTVAEVVASSDLGFFGGSRLGCMSFTDGNAVRIIAWR